MVIQNDSHGTHLYFMTRNELLLSSKTFLRFMHCRSLVGCPSLTITTSCCFQQMHQKLLYTETMLLLLEDTLKQPVQCYGYREFCRLWSEVVPYIRVMPPAADLCPICQDNVTCLLKSANFSEDEKTKLHAKAQDHLTTARVEQG